jgi:hypothetical protein
MDKTKKSEQLIIWNGGVLNLRSYILKRNSTQYVSNVFIVLHFCIRLEEQFIYLVQVGRLD